MPLESVKKEDIHLCVACVACGAGIGFACVPVPPSYGMGVVELVDVVHRARKVRSGRPPGALDFQLTKKSRLNRSRNINDRIGR